MLIELDKSIIERVLKKLSEIDKKGGNAANTAISSAELGHPTLNDIVKFISKYM